MNIAQLEYLAAFARTGDYGAAATDCFVTPQAISKSIRLLERELDIAIVERAGRGAFPTQAGIALARQAQRIIDEIAALKVISHQLKETAERSDTICIAIATTFESGAPVSRHLVQRFCEEGGPRPVVIEHLPDICLAAVESGAADCALVAGRADEPAFASKHIGHARTIALFSQEHDTFRGATATVADLSGRRVALPTDLRCLYPRLVESAARCGIRLSFEAVAPTPNAYRAFLERAGVVLAYENAPLASLPGTAAAPFALENDVAGVPVLLVMRADDPPPCADELHRFLSREVGLADDFQTGGSLS